MRMNLPVTNVERDFRDGETIVSKTDLKGIITYVNPYFCEMSGFSEAESIGQPHNFIRHPDMPPEAFADLWATLRAGRSWTALVKNRCRNGDHYWVQANATPIKEGNQIVGYMSVRTKASRRQIEDASQLYQQIRDGKAKGVAVRFGQVVHAGFAGWLTRLASMSLRTGLVAPLAILFALLSGMGAMSLLGIGGAAARDAILAMLGAGLLVALAGGYALMRGVVKPIRAATAHCEQLTAGNFRFDITIGRYDERGRLFDALKSMQTRLGFDLDSTRRAADAAQRINNALDHTSTGVMIADAKGTIIYMNKSIQAMFNDAETDIRKDLPNFRAGELMGQSIDNFHRNPAHQKHLLSTITSTHRATIKIGGRTFKLAANPVFDASGQRLGSSVEWNDITAEVKIQNEIQRIVEAANMGDLTQRIQTEGKDGFMKDLSLAINSLAQTTRKCWTT